MRASRFLAVLAFLLAPLPTARAQVYVNGVLQPPPLSASDVQALAPVQSVNGNKGLVTVPTLCRQQTAVPIAIPQTNPGVVSWTFPNTTCSFATPPAVPRR